MERRSRTQDRSDGAEVGGFLVHARPAPHVGGERARAGGALWLVESRNAISQPLCTKTHRACAVAAPPAPPPPPPPPPSSPRLRPGPPLPGPCARCRRLGTTDGSSHRMQAVRDLINKEPAMMLATLIGARRARRQAPAAARGPGALPSKAPTRAHARQPTPTLQASARSASPSSSCPSDERWGCPPTSGTPTRSTTP